MALSILDGNQSATTLSTILSSGQHITAHTVVSLGTQAITDIVSATSAGLTNTQLRASAVTVAGTVTANGGDGTFLVGGLRSGGKTALQLDTGTGYLQTKVESLPSLVAGTAQIGSVTASISNSLTISSLPAISGTVTANLNQTNFYDVLSYYAGEGSGLPVRPDGDFPISGTVTANVFGKDNAGNSTPIPVVANAQGFLSEFGIPIAWNDAEAPDTRIAGTSYPLPIQGTVTANGGNFAGERYGGLPTSLVAIAGFDSPNSELQPIPLYGVGDDVNGHAVGIKGNISGTVTANSSNGSLTTRFGSVTTANTAFATSAVTNANRKYLLIQNITTASNVITVGIGFTPTTTQGIQLFAGAGLTFEGSYIPTGAVNLLSSVTASCYTILEA